MSVEPITPGPDGGRNRLAAATWVLVGILAYRFASASLVLPIQPTSIPAIFLALAMSSSLLAVTLFGALGPLSPMLGYVALRYWALPSRARSWRNTVLLPGIVLPGIVVASLLSAFVAGLVSMVLLGDLLSSGAVVILTQILGGAAGLGLWVIEKLATRLLFGKDEAAMIGPALCRAHIAGIAAVMLATSLPMTVAIYVFNTPLNREWAKWLTLAAVLCGTIVHLLLTWRAWKHGSPPGLSVREIVTGAVVAFVGLSLIGAAMRIPTSSSLLQALTWEISYLASLTSF